MAAASERQQLRTQRTRHSMSPVIRRALLQNDLMEAYRSRPPYQRNDYLGWIDRAKRETTKIKRIAQTLDEQRSGDRYMNMIWKPRRTP